MMSSSILKDCPECYESQKHIILWRELPINPEIKAYRDAYISPVKGWCPDLTSALAEWGVVIEPEV